MSLRLIVLVAATAVAVSGCGKRGTLERPPPMFGHAEKTAPAPTRPKPLAPEQQQTTIRQSPIEGAPQDPRGGPQSPY